MPEAETQDGRQLRDELEAFVGKPVTASARQPGPDPVNLPMIRHWAAAFEL